MTCSLIKIGLAVLVASTINPGATSAQTAPPRTESLSSVNLDKAFSDAIAREAKSGFAALSRRDQILFLIWWLQADVNNGGFDQYYFNSGSNRAKQAPEALRAIGANGMARIVEAANAVFGADGPPADRNERQVALAALSDNEPWAKLDEQFWKYPDDIFELLKRYIGAWPVA